MLILTRTLYGITAHFLQDEVQDRQVLQSIIRAMCCPDTYYMLVKSHHGCILAASRETLTIGNDSSAE